MDQFSYLSVLLSIILGLAITQILKGLRGLVLARVRVRMYWLPVTWAVLVLIVAVQSWWAMFGLRHVENWTFLGFSFVLLQNVLLYLVAALVLPDFFGEAVDLRAHYFGHHRLFFGLFLLTALASLAKDLVLSGHLTAPVNLAFHGGFLIIAASAMLTAREAWHRLLPFLTGLLFLAYIAVLFARLP